ncbi:MAG: FHA domain-containing protein [Gammaproteobacteria bacterium]
MEIIIAREEPGRRLPTIHRFEQNQILIGRGWHCDLVLVDGEIDGEHARIVIDPESGSFLLEDLNSRNGIQVENHSVQNSHHANFGDSITIGQTTFSVNRASDEVAPATAYSNAERFLTRVGKPMTALMLAAFAILLTTLGDYLDGVRKFSWEASMESALSLGALLIMTALIGGGVAKLFKDKMRGWAFLWVMAALVILTELSSYLRSGIAFNTLSRSFADVLSQTEDAMILALGVAAALIISTNLKSRARNTITAAMVLGFIVISYAIPKLQKDDWDSSPQLQTTTLPPAFLVRDAEPSSQLTSMIQSAMKDARENAVERKAKRDEKDSEK